MDRQEAELVKDRTVLLIQKHNKDVSLLQPPAVDPVVELDHLEEPALLQLEGQTVLLAQLLLHNLAKICYL